MARPWYTVIAIRNRWRTTATWWLPEAATAREYVKLVAAGAGDDELICTLYRDLDTGAWFLARLYD